VQEAILELLLPHDIHMAHNSIFRLGIWLLDGNAVLLAVPPCMCMLLWIYYLQPFIGVIEPHTDEFAVNFLYNIIYISLYVVP